MIPLARSPLAARRAAGVGARSALDMEFGLGEALPLDGGRILVGLLPRAPSRAFASLEPYGMLVLIGALLVAPLLGAQTGIDLNFVWQGVARLSDRIIAAITWATGPG